MMLSTKQSILIKKIVSRFIRFVLWCFFWIIFYIIFLSLELLNILIILITTVLKIIFIIFKVILRMLFELFKILIKVIVRIAQPLLRVTFEVMKKVIKKVIKYIYTATPQEVFVGILIFVTVDFFEVLWDIFKLLNNYDISLIHYLAANGSIIILIAPFVLFITLFFFGNYFGFYGVFFLVIVNFIVSLSLLYCLGYEILLQNISYAWDTYLPFIYINPVIDTNWSFVFDRTTFIMFSVVVLISYLVHFYSLSYMRFDPMLIRFISLLSLFTFCMLLFVSSGNLIELFLGWEGVGLCSYLLVNFWFTRIQANKAAMKAMLVNRVGDAALLIFIALYYYVFRTFDFEIPFLLAESYRYSYLNYTVFLLGGSFPFAIHLFSILAFFLIIAMASKSAQLPLHTWLPDAMEGPTPVSALIHAATMVTAGVLLLIKFYFILEFSFLKPLLCIIGGLTALFGSIVAAFQYDIKKVIAYSTCSQLGYMVVACGLGHYDLALFHLFNHAFFKALLFLSAGVVIHALDDEQDMRKMGGLLRLLPITYMCMFLASFALMGLPFLSGFYSKDLIIELSTFSYQFSSYFAHLLLLIAAFFTAFYSYRLLYVAFINNPKGTFKIYTRVHEGDIITLAVLVILAGLSIVSGFVCSDFFIGPGSFVLNLDIIPIKANATSLDFEFFMLPWDKLQALFFSIFGLLCADILYSGKFRFEWIFKKFRKFKSLEYYYYLVFKFMNYKWFFDFIYNTYIVNVILNYSYHVSYKKIDKNFLELFGVNGVYYLLSRFSFFYKQIYNTYLYLFIVLLLLGFVAVLFFSVINTSYMFFFFFMFIYFFIGSYGSNNSNIELDKFIDKILNAFSWLPSSVRFFLRNLIMRISYGLLWIFIYMYIKLWFFLKHVDRYEARFETELDAWIIGALYDFFEFLFLRYANQFMVLQKYMKQIYYNVKFKKLL